jgi:hypothetical protein
MAEDPNSAFFTVLEQRGEAVVRAGLENNEWGNRRALVLVWLNRREEARLQQREERADRALMAAERSAKAAEDAAQASKESARWTLWTALVALFAIAVGVISGVLKWLLS